MKKISVFLTFGLLLYTSTLPLIAFDFDDLSTEVLAEEDDFDIDTDLNNISLENAHRSNLTRTPAENADKILFFFSIVTDPNALLNNPTYQTTAPIRTRPILEYPFALTYGFDIKDNNSLSLMFYLNSCSSKNFTQDSTTLNSYFLLGSPEKIASLDAINDITGEQTIERLAQSLALFDPATLQENRIGGLLESHIIHNKLNLIVQLPILYAERNLYLTPSQKSVIAVSSLGRMLETDGVDQNDFIYNHIVMDQFGFGDLKFKTMYQLHNTNRFNLDLGGFIILPTATALKQGIIGTWFDQNNERAYLDLTTIDPESLTAQNIDDATNFILAAIDKLSSNILNCPLGNNGHVVIAPSINFDWYFTNNWNLSSDFSLQIPLKAQEQRFYQKIQSKSAFLADYNAAYNSDSTTFTYYINQELQDLFFPYVFPTMVNPGIVFNSTNQFVYTYQALNFNLGSNFWYQQAESITNINIPNNGLPSNSNYSYDIAGATAASAAQEKLFGKISYNLDSTNYSWSLSLYGDITVWNSGIGNDFTLGLCIDGKF